MGKEAGKFSKMLYKHYLPSAYIVGKYGLIKYFSLCVCELREE